MKKDYGLEQFDDEFKPNKGFANSLEDVPDGDYQFLCTSADLKTSKEAGKTIFEMNLRVVGGEYDGVEGKKAVFLVSSESVAIFGGELCKLGFDADKWNPKHGRRFSEEFMKAKPQIPGMVFKAKKSKSKAGYLNITIKELLERRPVPAATPDAGSAEDPF